MNPHTEAETNTQRSVAPPVAKAKVVQAASHDRDDPDAKGYHTARVRVYGESSTQVAPILTSMAGDAHVPPVGSDVAVIYGPNEKPWIIGFWYAVNEDREPPNYQPGERVIGHPDTESSIRIRKDGHIRIITEGNSAVDIDHQTASVNMSGSNQTIESNTTEKIEFDTVEDDPEDLWDSSNYQMVVNSDGLHRITTSMAFPNPGQNNTYICHIYVNGSPEKRVAKQSAVNEELSIQVTTLERLESGDSVDVRVENGNGNDVDVLGSKQTTDFTIRRAGI